MVDSPEPTGTARPLTAAEAVDLSGHITGLMRAGLPLAQGLVALGAELPRGRMRRSMNELARMLESGVPLDQAVKNQYERIPPNLRGLVVAGMRSGGPGDLLSRFAQYASIRAELKRRLWVSLAYPLLTAGLACVLYVVLSLFFVTQFENIYQDFQIPLPKLTQLLISLTHFLNWTWFPAVIAIGVLFLTWLSARALLLPALRHSLVNRLPLIGTVWRSTSLAEFCHLLALLLESQLPMPEALRLTGEGVQDSDMESTCRAMAGAVESGEPLSAALKQQGLSLLGLANLVSWAEHQKSLPEVLHLAGSMFEVRARSHAAFAGTVLTFMCVLFVFSMVMVIPALMLPLITLISKLSG